MAANTAYATVVSKNPGLRQVFSLFLPLNLVHGHAHISVNLSVHVFGRVCVCALPVRRQMHTMLVCAGAYGGVLVVRKGIPKIAPPLGEAQDAWHRFPGKGAVVHILGLLACIITLMGHSIFAEDWFG